MAGSEHIVNKVSKIDAVETGLKETAKSALKTLGTILG
jgi:hypothetical protein